MLRERAKRITFSLVSFAKSNFLSLVLIALAILAWFLPIRVPDLFNVSYSTSLSTTLSTIAAALASILGIVFAMVFVALQIARGTYVSYAFREFFRDDRKLKSLFAFYTVTIVIAIVSAASMHYPLTTRNINLSYLSVILFCVCIIILYPYSKTILSFTTSQKKIKEIIDRVDIPLLRQIAVRCITDEDSVTPRFILAESTKKLLNLIGDQVSAMGREMIMGFLPLFEECAASAITHRQENVLRSVLRELERIHSFCAVKKASWDRVIELNQTLQSIIERIIAERKYSQVAQSALWAIERIWLKHLRGNVPSENELWLSHRDEKEKTGIKRDPNKELQWHEVSIRYPMMLSDLTDKAIEVRDRDAADAGLRSFTSVGYDVLALTLGDRQKTAIVKTCYYSAKTLTIKLADAGLYVGPISLLHFSDLRINQALDKLAAYSKEPLVSFCDTLIELARRGLLDQITLNDLGAIGRCCVDKTNGDRLYLEAAIYICDVFDRIRESIEAEASPENEAAYHEVYSQLESLVRWMEKSNKPNDMLREKVSGILTSFRRREEKEALQWPVLAE